MLDDIRVKQLTDAVDFEMERALKLWEEAKADPWNKELLKQALDAADAVTAAKRALYEYTATSRP